MAGLVHALFACCLGHGRRAPAPADADAHETSPLLGTRAGVPRPAQDPTSYPAAEIAPLLERLPGALLPVDAHARSLAPLPPPTYGDTAPPVSITELTLAPGALRQHALEPAPSPTEAPSSNAAPAPTTGAPDDAPARAVATRTRNALTAQLQRDGPLAVDWRARAPAAD